MQSRFLGKLESNAILISKMRLDLKLELSLAILSTDKLKLELRFLGQELPSKGERFFWPVLDSEQHSPPSRDNPIMVVVDSLDNNHRTRVLDLGGRHCNVNVPLLGKKVK